MIIFIGATLSKAAIGFISRRTLDSYNVEFCIGIVFKNYRKSLGFFCSFTFFAVATQ